MIGHKQGTPVTGLRKTLLKLIYRFTVHIQGIFVLSTWFGSPRYITLDEVNHYEKYLGPKKS